MVLLSDKFVCIFYSFLMYFSSLNCIWYRNYSSLLLLWKLHSGTIRDLSDLHSLQITHGRKTRLECRLCKSQPFHDWLGRDEVANCMIGVLYFLIFFYRLRFCQHTLCVQDYRMDVYNPLLYGLSMLYKFLYFFLKKT